MYKLFNKHNDIEKKICKWYKYIDVQTKIMPILFISYEILN